MTPEKAIAAVKKHGSVRAAAKALGVPRQTFDHHWQKSKTRDIERKSGKSLADFRAMHDKSFIIPTRIKEGLKQLGDGWEYEMTFAKICGVGLADLSSFRDEFSDFVVVVRRDGKRAWAGTKVTAQKMKEMIGAA